MYHTYIAQFLGFYVGICMTKKRFNLLQKEIFYWNHKWCTVICITGCVADKYHISLFRKNVLLAVFLPNKCFDMSILVHTQNSIMKLRGLHNWQKIIEILIKVKIIHQCSESVQLAYNYQIWWRSFIWYDFCVSLWNRCGLF